MKLQNLLVLHVNKKMFIFLPVLGLAGCSETPVAASGLDVPAVAVTQSFAAALLSMRERLELLLLRLMHMRRHELELLCLHGKLNLGDLGVLIHMLWEILLILKLLPSVVWDLRQA